MLKRLKLLAWGPIILAEWIIKRSLATVLWIAWRAHLNPFAFLRGKPATPGRYYIDQFLARYRLECSGRFLEFGDPRYRDLFPRSAIGQYDVLNIEPGPGVTVVGDIQSCPQIADNSYDVIVCTQVLEHVPNPFRAAAELQRILKPGGRLLLTVPAAYPYHAVPRDYWRFTRDSLQLLFGEHFGEVQIEPWGNRVVVVAAYWYWAYDQLPRDALLRRDPDNPQILSVYARK